MTLVSQVLAGLVILGATSSAAGERVRPAPATKANARLQALLDDYLDAAAEGDPAAKSRASEQVQVELEQRKVTVNGRAAKQFTAAEFNAFLDHKISYPKTAANARLKMRAVLQVCSVLSALCVNSDTLRSKGQFDLPAKEDFEVATPATSSAR